MDGFWTGVTRIKLSGVVQVVQELEVGGSAGQGTIYLDPTTMAFEIPNISLRANRPREDVVKDIRNACLVHGFFQVIGIIANACAVRMTA
jgi:hypothetical protein